MRSSNHSTMNILAVLFTILIFLVTWKLILPDYAKNKKQLAVLDTEINSAQDKLSSLDTAKADLASLGDVYKSITVSVSDSVDAPSIISELEAIALKNSIVLPSISIADPSSETSSTDLSAVTSAGTPIQITTNIKGKFDQLNGFITGLEKSVKFFNIKSMTYSMGDADIMGLSLQIEAYSRSAPTPL